jgi:soluble lytic murein transglycosylase-like protein
MKRSGTMSSLRQWATARAPRCHARVVLAAAVLALAPLPASAGAQREEHLAPSVVAGLAKAIADAPVPPDYANRDALQSWLGDMSRRLAQRVPNERERRELLATVHYEATRAGLDPQLLLAVMHHESGFKKYAISPVGARGYMQVMPFWVGTIGTPDQNLFNLRTNLRYGAVILRHYLVELEQGDLYRALGRYNGSLGRPEYPNAVIAAMNRHYAFGVPTTATASAAPAASVR